MKNKKSSGFILLEVLLSLVILGLVFASSMQAISSSLRSASITENLNVEATVAQQILSGIDRNEFESGTGSGKSESGFLWEVQKESISELENKYTVKIAWKEHGIDKQLGFVTIKCR
jgi:type II secretory pathway pseudopilin PulG